MSGERPAVYLKAILHMLRLFDKTGAKRSEIEVMCFGGADLFSRKI